LAELIHAAITSLDGFVEDREGKFNWAEPDEEVHKFVNNVERRAGTHLYGRRMYETMLVWETDPSLAAHSAVTRDFAEIWQAADKIVFSRTLEAATTARTRIERTFDPEAIRRLKATTARDMLIGGPDLAAHAFRAGLVDQYHVYLSPIIVGGGKPSLPKGVRLKLELTEHRRFHNGVVFLRYRAES
jgi:dihydrofolate reductase